MYNRDLHSGQEVERELLEASSDAPAFLEPADAALNDAATFVRLLVEVGLPTVESSFLVASHRDHRIDGMLAQPSPDVVEAVAFVSGERAR